MDGESRLGAVFREYAETGDEDVFAEFQRLTNATFVNIAWRVARQHGGAGSEKIEDQLQDIAMRLTANRKEVARLLPASPEQAKAYLLKLAANVCRDDWKSGRAERRDVSRNVPLPDVEDRLVDSGFARQDVPVLLSQIDSLLPADRIDRIVFGFYYKQGYTAAEIASLKQLNLGVKGVESRLVRIVGHLKRSLKGWRKIKGISARNSSL